MPRSSELSDFEKGIIIGYHKCGRSLRDISSDLKYPKSTVAYVIKKWKVSGDCRNVPRVGRPTKLGARDRRVLSREIRKNRTQPMALIREEFQKASGSIVSMNTIASYVVAVLRVGPLLLSGRQCQLSCFDVNHGLVWCQWSSTNGLACPEPRPEPYRAPLGRVASPNSGVHYPCKIGEGTSMSSPSRVDENTTSCHTKTCGKYAPEGSRCNCLSWRLYQLLILNNVFFFSFLSQVSKYLLVVSVFQT